MTVDLDRLKELLAKASKLPLVVDRERQDDSPDKHYEFAVFDGDGRRLFGTENRDASAGELQVEYDEDGATVWNERSRLDMELVSAAVNALPSLISELEAEREKVAKLRAENERLQIEISAARLSLTHPHGEIGVGADVEKVSGYRWPGEVRSVFTTRAGMVRFVVECTSPDVEGALHIYNGDQIIRTAARAYESTKDSTK